MSDALASACLIRVSVLTLELGRRAATTPPEEYHRSYITLPIPHALFTCQNAADRQVDVVIAVWCLIRACIYDSAGSPYLAVLPRKRLLLGVIHETSPFSIWIIRWKKCPLALDLQSVLWNLSSKPTVTRRKIQVVATYVYELDVPVAYAKDFVERPSFAHQQGCICISASSKHARPHMTTNAEWRAYSSRIHDG